MPYTVVNQTHGYAHIRIHGVFSVQDLLALQGLASNSFGKDRYFRILIELVDFKGWSHQVEWENTEFLPTTENQAPRLAFVGDERWRHEVFMFTGQPMRAEQIAFFSPEQFEHAEAWLKQDIVR